MNGTILLVDDSRVFIELEKEFLQGSRVEVLTANDGQEALHFVKTRRPQLVFMDILMPNMDGVSCCRAIRSDSAIFDTPVVMITSQGSEKDKEKCFSAGCDYFLTKPLDRDLFLHVAHRFIPSVNRRVKRLPFDVKGTLRINGSTVPCILHDVSAGGAFVETDYFGAPKGSVEISFSMPDGTTIECLGSITWANRVASKKPRGLGVKFALLPLKAYEALSKFIDPVN
jgi:CheY-like chemotaxis protein